MILIIYNLSLCWKNLIYNLIIIYKSLFWQLVKQKLYYVFGKKDYYKEVYK